MCLNVQELREWTERERGGERETVVVWLNVQELIELTDRQTQGFEPNCSKRFINCIRS